MLSENNFTLLTKVLMFRIRPFQFRRLNWENELHFKVCNMKYKKTHTNIGNKVVDMREKFTLK